MSSWTKYKLLMWKHWKLVYRSPIRIIFDLIIPLILLILLLVGKYYKSKEEFPEYTYGPIPINNVQNLQDVKGYCPNDIELLTNIMSSFPNAKGFAKSRELQKHISGLRNAGDVGIEFDGKIKKKVPRQLKITLRFSTNSTEWSSDEIFPKAINIGPGSRNPEANTGGPPNYAEKFVHLMYTLTQKFLEKSGSEAKLPNMYLRRFPSSAYIADGFLEMWYSRFFSALFVFLFFMSFVTLTLDVNRDRTRQIKESLKIMGVQSWIQWAAWYTRIMIPWFIVVIIFCIIVKWNTTNGRIFEDSNILIIFIFFLLCALAISSSAFFFSVLFRKDITAAIVVMTFAMIQMAVFQFCRGFGRIIKNFLSISPFLAMPFGLDVIVTYEAIHEGVHWNNFIIADEINSISLGEICAWLILSSLIALLLALYFEAILPGNFGVPKEPTFFLKSEFWSGKKAATTAPERQNLQPKEFFEDEPRNSSRGIEMKNLTKDYNSVRVVDGVFLNLYQDQITILLGHNGAGKTTTISMLIGMIPPTEGTAIIQGYNINTEMQSIRESLGICFQHDLVFDHLTVKENLEFVCRLRGVRANDTGRVVHEILNDLGLTKKENKKVSTLSGGMRRKLCVGMAFCGNAKIVFLDEPTAGLDPAGRRLVWDFLLKHKAGRTILMTTHFMDEADVLGDRVAIMAGGKVQCCGSNFFLKKKYGAEYRLIIELVPRTNPKKITTVVQKHVPKAEAEDVVGTEICYLLPAESAPNFPKLLEELENDSKNLGISTFGVSMTTMLEIFMKIGASEKLKRSEYQKKGNASNLNYTCDHIDTGLKLLVNQTIAISLKKVKFYKRAMLSALLMNLMMTYLIVLMVYYMSKKDTADPSLLNLGFDQYSSSITIVENSSDIQSSYLEMLKGMKTKVELTRSISETLFELTRISALTAKYRYIVGSSFKKDGAYAWFNNEPFHSIPLSVQLLLQNAYKSNVGFEYDIFFSNHPIKFRTSESDINSEVGILSYFFLALMLPSIATIYIALNVKERASQSKHLQFAAGVSMYVFHLVAFFWDLLVALLFIIVCVISFAIFPVVGFSTVSEIVLFVIIYFSYFVAAIPWIYIIAFLFMNDQIAIQVIGVIIMIPCALCLGIYVLILTYREYTNYFRILLWIGRVTSPPFIFTDALMKTGIKKTCEMNMEFCLEFQGTREECEKMLDESLDSICHVIQFKIIVDIIIFYIFAILMFLLIFAIDSGFLRRIMYVSDKLSGRPPKRLEEYDDDVLDEQNYINTHSIKIMKQENILLVKNLTKYYKNNFLAVNGVYVKVGPAECFGLLGINGAGKTTTFKMLTGQETIDYGNAWISGYNLKKQLSSIRQTIGYCPQFDGFIDELTAREHLKMYGLIKGIPFSGIDRKIEDVAKDFDFDEHLDKKTEEMSGGNRRKLSSAMSVLGDPAIIFMDEPTTGMDPATKRVFWNTIENFRASGKSVILTTHSMEEAEALCTRVVIMAAGNFRCLGSIQHLKSKFARGFAVKIKMKKPRGGGKEMPDTRKIENFMQEKLPSAVLTEKHQDMLTYEVEETDMKWSAIFAIMEDAKKKLDIEDYSVGQPTLEQVFLRISFEAEMGKLEEEEIQEKKCCSIL